MPQEDQPMATVDMHKNLMKSGYVVSEIYKRTDRKTDTLITILHCSHSSWW